MAPAISHCLVTAWHDCAELIDEFWKGPTYRCLLPSTVLGSLDSSGDPYLCFGCKHKGETIRGTWVLMRAIVRSIRAAAAAAGRKMRLGSLSANGTPNES